MFHYGLVPEAMNIPVARAAVKKEWRKLRSQLAWDEQKVKSTSAVVKKGEEGTTDGPAGEPFGSLSCEERGAGMTLPTVKHG